MKVKTSIAAAFVAGAVLASLPYTLGSRNVQAQNAGPAQGGGQFPPQGGGQGFPGGPGGQGFPGQGGGQFGGGQFRMGGPVVNSMTTSGEFLYAAAGDTIYKIHMSTMKIEGQTKLPMQQPMPGQGQGQGQVRRGQGQGGGNIPPSSSK